MSIAVSRSSIRNAAAAPAATTAVAAGEPTVMLRLLGHAVVHVIFDRYNQPVSLTAPADAVDLNQLVGSQK